MCASPSSSTSPLYLYLPRNLSYCDESFLNSRKLNNCNNDKNHQEIEFNVTAAKLRKRILLPRFQKIMSDLLGDEELKGNEAGPKQNNGQCEEELEEEEAISFDDEGIFINLMDDLNLESEPGATASNPPMVISEDKDSAAASSSSSTDTSALQSPSPGIVGVSATDDSSDNCGTRQRAIHTTSPSAASLSGGHSIDKVVCGETPMAGICAESLRLDSQSSSPSRSIVSSVQSFFSGNPQNDTKLLDLLSPASPIYDDDEFNFPRGELRKTTSLKSQKTPPGTPRRKKVVRFADVMGLDLESVIHVLNMDSPPKIPPSALADLQSGIEDDRKSVGSRLLTACFSQPSASEGFMARVCAEKVCLENAVISDLTITGIVRVANIGFHKTVHIRYTTNNWSTHHDVAASYVHSSCDGPTDRFSFSIVAPSDFSVGSRLEFAISYTCGDVVYWDSNHKTNYRFECYAKTGLTEAEDAWMHFL